MRFLVLRLALVSCLCAAISLSSSSAFAADQVVLKYRIFRESLSVKELSSFAETGQLSTSLRVNFALARQDPEAIRGYLTQPVKVNFLFLDRVLNSPVGNVVLDEVSQVIHTRSRRADRQALRAALVLSARRDNEITLIEIIQNYPTPEVEVEGERLVSALRQISRLGGTLEDLLDAIKGVGEKEK